MNIRGTTEAKMSVTAISVAMAKTRMLSSRYRSLPLYSEVGIATHLWSSARRSLGMTNWLLSGGISMAPFSWQEAFFRTCVMPGYDSIIFFRALMIKNRIDAAIARGVSQVVFLGGGLDVRPLMTSLQNVRVYVVDRGATRTAMIGALRTMPTEFGIDHLLITEDNEYACCVGDYLKLINCDLGVDNLLQRLEDYGYYSGEDTLVIAEGLTTYLDEATNRKLLQTISMLLTPNSEFVLSYKSGSRVLGSIESQALQESQEVYQFALNPDAVIPFVGTYGFSVCEKFDATEYLRVGGDPSADYYENNPQAVKEHYYSIRPSSLRVQATIADVPVMEFNVSAGVSDSYCNLV